MFLNKPFFCVRKTAAFLCKCTEVKVLNYFGRHSIIFKLTNWQIGLDKETMHLLTDVVLVSFSVLSIFELQKLFIHSLQPSY